MVSCGKCGAPALPDSAFCRVCGAPLTAASGAGTLPLARFVGPNAARYLERWDACDRRQSSYSWNWSAFLFGLFWMAYRKMYVNAGILLGIATLESVATVLFHVSEAAGNAMNVALAIVIGMQGNHWYRKHAEARIAHLTASVPPAELGAAIERDGGTSPAAALAAIAFLVAIVAALAMTQGPIDAGAIRT